MSVRTAQPARVTAPMAIGLGLVALAARVPSAWAVAVTVGVGVVGILAPLGPEVDAAAGKLGARTRAASLTTWLAALGLGLAALLIASRLPAALGLGPQGAGPIIARARPVAIGSGLVAAVAEEAFFRRLVYGWLATWGAGVAICGSALAFAAIHVPVYGFAVLPIDAAAGLLLGWQRWVTGGWSASCLTHAAANLIAGGVIP